MDYENRQQTEIYPPAPQAPVERRDILPVVVITLIYAAVAFFKLGNLTAPQSFSVSQTKKAPLP